MTAADFSRQVVETVAKRSGNHCSNPDCGVLTCGPAEEVARVVIIGEAAHIYAARSGGARFLENMSDNERADVTNAVWLCRNCHKLVDNDPIKYPVEILFEWRRQHESETAARLGKPGDAIREKVLSRQLAEFASCSYLAQQIVIDKPSLWEYKLTVELLRTRMGPVVARWASLKRGLYVRPVAIVAQSEIIQWVSARLSEAEKMPTAFSGLVNEELPASWGVAGHPGDAKEILRVCDLMTECAEQALRWEESIRFATVPPAFDEMRELFAETAGRMLEQLARVPIELGEILAQDKPDGQHDISLVLDLPPGWAERFSVAQKRAFATLAG